MPTSRLEKWWIKKRQKGHIIEIYFTKRTIICYAVKLGTGTAMKNVSRRQFIKLSGVSAAGVVLASAGCAPAQTQPPAPGEAAQPAGGESQLPSKATAEVAPTDTAAEAAPTPTKAEVVPTATATPSKPRPEIIRFYPEQKSRVVRARSAEVWKDDALDPTVVREMLDRAITGLTGIDEVPKAWQALFKPEERIVLKVNTFRNSLIWTHVPLVYAITDSLQEAGIPGEQITIFDFYTTELETGGFTINKDGPGVRCYGTDSAYSTSVEVGNFSVRLSDILAEADALINVPVLKSHMISGLTFALKNHYGSVNNPGALHDIKNCLGSLNALPQIKDITRLVIGDALEANTKYKNSFPYWDADARGDSILASFDPLAMDRIGLDILVEMAEEKGNSTTGIVGMCNTWLDTCDAAGIGTCQHDNIELMEV